LFKFRKILRKKPNYNVQTEKDRLEIIKRIKWKDINAKRVRLKIKKQAEPFLKNIEKKFMSILPFRRNKAPKFHDPLLPLAWEINRSIFIKKALVPICRRMMFMNMWRREPDPRLDLIVRREAFKILLLSI
jgi:hypothetical protein